MDTVFALASARGKAGVAVVRASGPAAHLAIETLCSAVKPRRATLRTLRFEGEHLDDALVLWFPGPDSFTGEDVVEFHLHGSIATVNAVLHALGGMPGLRMAEPGEFTRRALENERLDLAQIEGLADLVEAETQAQRSQALRVLSGALGAQAEVWRSMLIRAAALIEATIDFADEEVPTDVVPEVLDLAETTLAELHRETKGTKASEMIRDGFEVAIVGAPNVGKSSLLNYLAGREAAITSETAGTTRDVIEVRLEVAGLAVTLLDTAGIRETEDKVEALGIDLAKRRAEAADLRIFLSRSVDRPVVDLRSDDIVLVSKSDLGGGDISSVTGEGIEELLERVGDVLSKRVASAGIATRERHRIAMEKAVLALEIAIDRLKNAPELAEIIAADFRDVLLALDSLVGRVDVENLLDEIFSSFCIGK